MRCALRTGVQGSESCGDSYIRKPYGTKNRKMDASAVPGAEKWLSYNTLTTICSTSREEHVRQEDKSRGEHADEELIVGRGVDRADMRRSQRLGRARDQRRQDHHRPGGRIYRVRRRNGERAHRGRQGLLRRGE